MKNLSVYLLDNGTCKSAIEFYQSVFQEKLTTTKFGDTPAKNHKPESLHERVSI